MPRTKKSRDSQPPEDPNAKAPETSAAPEGDDEAAAESRASQLDQIRAALAEGSAPAEMAELPAPTAEDLAAETAGSQSDEAPPSVEAPPVAATPVEPPAPTSAWVPPPVHPPAPPPPSVAGTRAAFGSSSSNLAVGIVLVVVGIFFLIIRLANIDLSNYGWPLFVILPGLTLLVVGFVSLGTGAVIPGGIVTMTGLVLAYQNATGDWASWAYAWALVVPFGVGVGLLLAGLRDRDDKQLRQGRNLMFLGLLIFMIGFVFFESILNISGIDYGVLGRAALPALLIVIGVTLLARSIQRSRTERR